MIMLPVCLQDLLCCVYFVSRKANQLANFTSAIRNLDAGATQSKGWDISRSDERIVTPLIRGNRARQVVKSTSFCWRIFFAWLHCLRSFHGLT